jgi:hypothetical protein
MRKRQTRNNASSRRGSMADLFIDAINPSNSNPKPTPAKSKLNLAKGIKTALDLIEASFKDIGLGKSRWRIAQEITVQLHPVDYAQHYVQGLEKVILEGVDETLKDLGCPFPTDRIQIEMVPAEKVPLGKIDVQLENTILVSEDDTFSTSPSAQTRRGKEAIPSDIDEHSQPLESLDTIDDILFEGKGDIIGGCDTLTELEIPCLIIDGQKFPLTHEVVTLGRQGQVPIDDSWRAVSRRHCQIHRELDSTTGEVSYKLTDLESTHGTGLNGERISEAILGDGDTINLVQIRQADGNQNWLKEIRFVVEQIS